MVQTRAQERGQGIPSSSTSAAPKSSKSKASTASKKKEHNTEKTNDTKQQPAPAPKKRSHPEKTNDDDAHVPEPKKTKPQSPPPNRHGSKTSNPKLQTLLSKYGALPLQDISLPNPTSPTPDTILALVLHAMLTSARISHELAYKSVRCLIDAGYHDLDTLSKSSWQERTEVLTEGGYTRYREKTATGLGELAEFVRDKYDSDLNNLLRAAKSTPSQTRTLLKEIKGLGDVGLDIFQDTAQGVWPALAPFIDPRSRKTAEAIGLGGDVQSLWKEVGEDAESMCRLAGALTTVRLEGREGEFR
ncbi:MAG: hypothetical protein M1833_006469 [Piccolia ochrophora]|nr:MAG: hypothetical protein M1833_006469 [Piccolia ochrophora]